ncbi:primosomal replication protein PriC [Corallincola platygyrae]|uniref:Primosomal replication protein PriC n=1 Tax=Corallincola platygyrae TaxID=1193278 RepID=A0ABW4XR89_9GAMM
MNSIQSANLEKTRSLINALGKKIKSESLSGNIFHQELFGPYSLSLKQAFDTCLTSLGQLEQAIQCHKSETFLQYYAERLEDQLLALARAVQIAKPNFQGDGDQNALAKLTESINKHRDYERRLLARVRQCQKAVEEARSDQFRDQWRGWLHKEKERLQKCRNALTQLEEQLTAAQRQRSSQ